MLFDRWQSLRDQAPERLAVLDVPAGRSMTFGDLGRELDAIPESTAGDPCLLSGNTVSFITGVLSAWRDGRPVVPFDSPVAPPLPEKDLPVGTAHLKVTSGTTGVPRFVRFSAEQIAADADAVVETMGLTPETPNLGVVSLAHSYGFSNLVTPLLLHGIPLVLGGNALPESIRRALEAAGQPLVVPAVPAMWQAWERSGVLEAPIALAISAGAPLPLQLEQEVFRQRGLKIHNFYGSSECGGIAYDPDPEPREDPGFVGTAMRGVQIARGEEGTVAVSGAAVGEGYWPDGDPALEAGVFRPGDQVEMAEGGRLYLRGRLGDVINVAGRKVDPAVIEGVISRCPRVQANVVFGVPSQDEGRAEDIVAIVSLTSGDTDSISKEVRRSLPGWQLPRKWIAESSLTPDGRGKISRAWWKAWFLDRYRL